MNTELRSKLKYIDNELRKFGYFLDITYNLPFLGFNNVYGNGPETYIRLDLIKKSVGPNTVKFYFTAMPCRLPAGSVENYWTVEQSEAIVNVWKKLLKLSEKLNEIEIVGTCKEITECIMDIQKKIRK